MLESLRVRPALCVQLRSGPLGSVIDSFVVALKQTGYTSSVIRRHVHAAAVFNAWMARHRIAAHDVDEHVVAQFAGAYRRWRSPSRPRGQLNAVVTGVHRIAAFLWAQGAAVRQSNPVPVTAIDRWVEAFGDHLTHVRGATHGTQRIYLRYARALLTTCWPTAQADWSALTAERVSDFVRAQAAALSRSASRSPVSATRSFVRFLVAAGVVRGGLEGAVPTVRQWKLAALPRGLAEADVQRVLTALDTTTASGVRDQAIILVLSRLGLRAGEVAALCVSHVDWQEGYVRVVSGKSGRERVLPLPEKVGLALVRVLKTRPACNHTDALFLRTRPPYRPITASGVTAIAQRALRRARIPVSRLGAHAFRHTVATQLVQHGVSMKTVSDVLGHAQLETTAIYAKLDVDTLGTVALPWPGGDQ